MNQNKTDLSGNNPENKKINPNLTLDSNVEKKSKENPENIQSLLKKEVALEDQSSVFKRMMLPNEPLSQLIKDFRPIDWTYDKVFLKTEVAQMQGSYPLMDITKSYAQKNFLRNENARTPEYDYLQYIHYSCQDYALQGDLDENRIYDSRRSPLLELSRAVKQSFFQLEIQKEQMAYSLISNEKNYPEDHLIQARDWKNHRSFDLLKNLRQAKNKIAEKSGFEPNRLLISRDVFEMLQENEILKKAFQYSEFSQFSLETLAQYLALEKVELASPLVLSRTKKSDYLFKNMALLYYYPEDPSMFSFARVFSLSEVPAVYKWQNREGGRLISYSVRDAYELSISESRLACLFINPLGL